jgi:hypothetical protein
MTDFENEVMLNSEGEDEDDNDNEKHKIDE